jgi:hypothetical protein
MEKDDKVEKEWAYPTQYKLGKVYESPTIINIELLNP